MPDATVRDQRRAAESTPAAPTPQRCSLDAAEVETLTVAPPEGEAGAAVVLTLHMAIGISDCLAPRIQFTFDAASLGDPVELHPNPGAIAEAQIPADARVGPHVIAAAAVGDDASLGEVPFEVLAPAARSGWAGAIWWWPAALGGALLVAMAFRFGRRRHQYGHPRLSDHPDGVCDTLRQSLAGAERAVFDARALADDAAEKAHADAEAAIEERVGELLDRYADGTDGEPASAVSRFHLLDHENPYAPMQADGRLGWFYPTRQSRVAAIVVHTSRDVLPATVSPTLGVADAYAKAEQPSSVHALAGPDGVVEMLPDEYTAWHTEGANRATLGIEVVLGGDPDADAAAIEHAASWVAQKAADHGIPIRRVDRAAFAGGQGGIVGHCDLVPLRDDPGESFPWCRMLELARRAIQPPVLVKPGLPTGSVPIDHRALELAQRVDDASAKAQDAADRVAEAQELAAQAVAILDAKRRALWACEARVPAEQTLEPPELEAPERDDRWYLLENENEHAARRANGKRGHYRPDRELPVRGIVVHVGESRSAVAIADHFAGVARPSSAHVAIDAEGWINLLPDEMEAFHARHANRQALAMVLAYTADDWGTDPATEDATMELAARWCAQKARIHGFPIRRLTRDEWKTGDGGLIAHSDIDPGSGSDPGDGFDWDAFLAMVEAGSPGA